jgi:hypothetical protein
VALIACGLPVDWIGNLRAAILRLMRGEMSDWCFERLGNA